MQPDSAAFLWDVRAAATRISAFIVGEALKNLRNADPDTARQIPEIARIISLRDILAHGYAVVDDSVV
ncbi:MAG: hypothetical protein LH471_11995 [Salinibacterium sp.]|nr:hypothetical protein [Salinibacterium sp.]